MALFSPSESPAVVVREIDLTGGVPNVQSSTGAIAGQFKWGPVGERVTIANETELVETFGAPVDSDRSNPSMSRYVPPGLVVCSLDVADVVTATAVCGVCEKGAVNVFAMIKVPYD